MISTVDSVDKEMQRDGKYICMHYGDFVMIAFIYAGIFGGEFFIQDLKRQWLDPQLVAMQKEVCI